jgi:hypothetical protein
MQGGSTTHMHVVKISQRDLVLASIRRGVGKDSCAGAKNGAGAGKLPRAK